MARRIVTDTFLTITGPGTTIKVCRALQDANGNVAVWWKPKTAPQRVFTVGKAGLTMRGKLIGPDGTAYDFRRRGVSCTWAICKGKFTTKQVAAWWPDADGGTAAPSAQLLAAADAAAEEPVPDPVRERAAAAARASRSRTRPVTASERRAARARARAARVTKAAVAERRAAAEALRTPPNDDGPLPEVPTLDPAPAPEPEVVTVAEVDPVTDETIAEVELPELTTDPEPTDEPAPDPVAVLDLTPRTENALTAAGVATIPQLIEQTPETLATIKGIGPKAVSEISDHLAAAGHSLTEGA